MNKSIIALIIAVTVVISTGGTTLLNETTTQAYNYPTWSYEVETTPTTVDVDCSDNNGVYPYLINHQIWVDSIDISYETSFSFDDSSSQAPIGISFVMVSADEDESTIHVNFVCGTVPP